MAVKSDRHALFGAIPIDQGVRFSVFAPQAEAVTLLLFRNKMATRSKLRHELKRKADGSWEAIVEGARIGDLYGYSVQGPRDGRVGEKLAEGHLLLDPWAFEIGRLPRWELDVEPPFVAPPLARVADRRFDWQGVKKPRIDPAKRVVYEVHVKGATILHAGIPEGLRGTYLGLCHPAILEHLQRLGVTTIELLPVHAHMDDRHLVEKGLSNYWGYSTLAWFAPHPAYASEPDRSLDEFRTMVRELHRAGFEVVLDVVYNHSCEGGLEGPDLSLRGFGTWYLRDETDEGYRDLTGCGNTLDFGREGVRKFVLQSLRHWAEHCHVDGFRFDLASVHARGPEGFDPTAPFFAEMARDPVLAHALRIAEPWDATHEGYGLGRYPAPWMEWNDRFRDDARLFWRGDGSARAFGLRLAGSPDIFIDRSYGSSVNFVTCHDGFTLRDLVTWSRKRNEANREGGRDGSDWNHSDNLGVEGEGDDPNLLERRVRRARNLLASLLLAPGTPMLLGGDEWGRTQEGNNNAYCQDNTVSWIRWRESDPWPDAAWIGRLVALRRELGAPVSWDWLWEPEDRDGLVGVRLEGVAMVRLLLANRSGEPVRIPLPGGNWRLRFASNNVGPVPDTQWSEPELEVPPGSFLVLDASQNRRRVNWAAGARPET